MQINPIGWVEIPVTNLDRAEKFYKDFFGFVFVRQPEKDGYTMSWFPMDEGYGSGATLIMGDGYEPSYSGCVVYFTAPDNSVTSALKKAHDHGVKIIAPKTDIGEHGFFAFLEDSEGNRIGIHSMNG